MNNEAFKLRCGIIIAVMASVIYGAHPAADRAVYADGGNATLILLVTTWFRAITLAAYCKVTGKRIFQNRQSIRQALWGGLSQTVSIFALFASLAHLSGPIAIIIIFTHALMLLFFMAWRREIKLDFLTLLTTLSTLLGLMFVLDIFNQTAKTDWIGISLAFFAALITAARQYIYGKQMKGSLPAIVGAENFLFAAVFATIALAFVPALHLPHSLAGYGWLALASASLAGGTFCMFYGIALLGAFRYSLFAKMEPLFTSFYSVWFLGEVLKAHQYFGIALVIGSLALYQVLEQKKIKNI